MQITLFRLLTLTILLGAATASAQTAPEPKTPPPDLGKTLTDNGPGSLQPIASVPGDALDAMDMSNLLDRRTEAAIKRGLDNLKKIQESDGAWGKASDQNREGYTAFAMIAFMINGHFPNKKQPYGETMTRALNYLLKEAKSEFFGYIGKNMYAHGLCTVALSEVWGQTEKDDEVREVLKAAVKVILNAQNSAGGWRYKPVPAGDDLSVTAMQVVALASARQAGIFVPDDTINRGVRYLSLCSSPTDGGFAYMPGPGVSGFARSGAAVTSLMLLGRHDAPQTVRGFEYIRKEAKKALGGTESWTYAMYYATCAMYIGNPKDFQWWYPQIRDILLSKQTADGSFGGRGEYDTSVALIVLGFPYGFVPTYQR